MQLTDTPHLQFILDNSELLFLPRKASPIHNCIACDSGAMNLGVTLDDQLAFCCQHCYDHPLLQISAIQHHEDNYVPHTEGHQGVGPGSSHLASRLLQLPSGWFACVLQSSSAAHPEYSSPAGLQPTLVQPHYTPPPHPAPVLPTLQ